MVLFELLENQLFESSYLIPIVRLYNSLNQTFDAKLFDRYLNINSHLNFNFLIPYYQTII